MRLVLQRVSEAQVSVAGATVGTIGRGFLVLVGIETADSAADGLWLAQKVAKLRVFPDDGGHMNLAITDIAGDILVVSQFTLCASLAKGSRPSFSAAAKPEQARELYELFVEQLSALIGRSVQTGRFGALMRVSLVNDGPITLLLDSRRRD